MYFASVMLIVFLGSEQVNCAFESDYEVESKNHDWDVLIFTQHWPITVCYEWKEKTLKNVCSFPTLRDIWTIHGIWPTKIGTKGPTFCNNSWHFDPAQISPLEQHLNIYWINVEKNTPLLSLWKHEWIKHGTCAAALPELDDETKYFKQGLDWIGKYDMQSILAKSGILPNKTQGYTAEDINEAIKSALDVNPIVECIKDTRTDSWYISEIRLCFNKTLELIDCDGIKDPLVHLEGDILTNCPLTKPVIYPSVVPVPPTLEILEYDIPWQLNLYRFLQFLIWFTL